MQDIAPQLIMPEDASQVIHRQEFYFEQEDFLQAVLKSQEFRPTQPDGSQRDSQWLAENKRNPLKALKEDLHVVPRINAGAFAVTMSAHDPNEAYTLVQAAVQVYMDRLRSDSATRRNAYLTDLDKKVKEQEGLFQSMSDALADFSKRQGVDVLKSRFDIEKNALQGLNDDFTRSDAAATSAEQQYNVIKKLKDDGKEVPLSSDLLMQVENDFKITSLQQERLQWEQERAAAEKDRSTTPQRLEQIDARLKKIDDQIDAMRTKLMKDARDRMQKFLEDEATTKRFLADFIGNIRKQKEEIVTGIGQNLLVWQQKVDALKEQQDLVYKLRTQYNSINTNSRTDDTRVTQIGQPSVPYLPSWPKWYQFFPVGTLAGLGLSALLAYLFVLTDTRVRTPRDLSKTLQMPVLGFVPDESDDRMLNGNVETAILSSPASMVAESFRQIRGHITAQTAHNPVNTLIVSSVGPGGGSTTVATNLASAMALNDLRVLLVDANFYRPALNKIFKQIPAEGLTDAVADPSIVDSCIAPHQTLSRLHIMGAGSHTNTASAELFESKAFREVLDNLKSKYDMVIFDGAPLNLTSDSMALAARVDGVVPVVRAGEVSRGAVSRVRDQIRSIHGNLLGFVLNAAQTSNTGYFKENYRRFHQYARRAPKANVPE